MSGLVVKVGGRVLLRNLVGVIEDVARVARSVEVVLVHGGGDVVTKYSRRFGVEPRFVVSPSGVRSRYTSREELEVYVMVMAGKINKEIVAALHTLGAPAVGLSGADASILRAVRKRRIIILDERGRKRVIEGGYTGKIVEVNAEALRALLGMGYVAVIAPIAIGEGGELLNVDADQAATSIAKALRASTLILLTDVEGVIINGNVVRELTPTEIPSIIKEVGFGMRRKLLMAGEAAAAGVGRVVIAPGLAEAPITNALEGAAGTLVRCRQ